jgi:hypothetical protein
MSRPSHSRRWTTEQLHQHKLLGHKLQLAHARAAQVLIRLARLQPAQMQYEGACNDLVDVVHSVGLLIACCEAIKVSGFRPKFRVINVVFVNACDFCLANPKSRQPDDENSLEPDPGWGIQVETLLRLTTLTALHSAQQRCSSPHNLKKSSRSLADLNKTLLREQRYLKSLDRWPVPDLKVSSDFREICEDCGHRVGKTPLRDTGDTVDVGPSLMLEGSR